MQFRKKGIKILATILALFTMSIPAFATPTQLDPANIVDSNTATPRWVHIADIFPDLSISGNTLYPEVYVEAVSDSAGITGTMYLQKSSGGSWSTADSWVIGDRGNAFLSESYEGESGYKYRTKVVVAVNGEKATAYSLERSI